MERDSKTSQCGSAILTWTSKPELVYQFVNPPMKNIRETPRLTSKERSLLNQVLLLVL